MYVGGGVREVEEAAGSEAGAGQVRWVFKQFVQHNEGNWPEGRPTLKKRKVLGSVAR